MFDFLVKDELKYTIRENDVVERHGAQRWLQWQQWGVSVASVKIILLQIYMYVRDYL